MIRPLPAIALISALATAAPAHAQDDDARRRDVDVNTIERRTWRLLRENGPSVLSVRVITRASTLPRLVLPGVTLAPPGGEVEQVDATGFLATPDGHVVTTAAALRNAAMVEVCFADGTVRDADVVGIDAPFRIAVLRTRAPGEPKALSVPARMTSTESALGWFFQATRGRPDVDLATVRPAQARSTSYDRYLFAPRSLMPGAAGGPLVDTEGRLLGVAVGEVGRATPRRRDVDNAGSTTRRSRQQDAPSTLATLFVRGDDVQRAVRDIVRFGHVRRPLLGVILEQETNRIDQLVPGGPAERAGFREGDLIVGVDGQVVRSLEDVTRALLRMRTGQSVDVAIDRGGQLSVHAVRLDDVATPPLPDQPPLPGAELEISAGTGPDGERQVQVTRVVPDSALHRAGLRAGDRLVRVDDRSAMRFLARFRMRPADSRPTHLAIERDGTVHELALGR